MSFNSGKWTVPEVCVWVSVRAEDGLKNVFWALNVLVINNGADVVVSEFERENSIANLTTAGRELARAVSERVLTVAMLLG